MEPADPNFPRSRESAPRTLAELKQLSMQRIGAPVEIGPGFESLSQEETQNAFENIFNFLNSLSGNSANDLRNAGIKINLVAHLMNTVMYDEDEKTLYIRYDADVHHMLDYIDNAVVRHSIGMGDKKEGAAEPEQLVNKNGLVIKVGDRVEWKDALSGASGHGTVIELHATTGSTLLDRVLVEVDGSYLVNVYIDDIVPTGVSENTPPLSSSSPFSPEPKPELLTPEPQSSPQPPADAIPTPEPVPATQTEKIPEWKKGEEWRTLEEYRKYAIFAELFDGYCLKYKGENESIENFRARYKEYYHEVKELVADKIRKTMTAEAGWTEGDGIPPEEKVKLDSKINDVLFEELVRAENDAYLDALRKARGETKFDKALEMAKNLLGTKAVKWYLGLSRKQRMALSFGVGSIAGLAFGATVAPGAIGMASYLAWRAARVGLSGTAGMKAGEWANKKWSIEELENAKAEEIADLKNSDLPLEQKSEGLADIEKRYKWQKIKMTMKKVGTTVAAGAGTGFLTGLAEHAVMGAGGVAKSALESKVNKRGIIQENKLPSRKGFEPNLKSQEHTPERVNVSPAPRESPQPSSATESVAPAEISKEIFSRPEVVTHTVGQGDSTWKLLGDTLENNSRFHNLTGTAQEIEAKKTFVISWLTNEVLKDPSQYGTGPNGEVTVGNTVNFANLFKDSPKFNEILNDAEHLKPTQISSIVENNAKIATYLREHPNVKLTNDKVAEILATKPRVAATIPDTSAIPETPTEQIYQEGGISAPEPASGETYTEGPESGWSDQEIIKDLESKKLPKLDQLEEMQRQVHQAIKEQSEIDLKNLQSPKLSGHEMVVPRPPRMDFNEWLARSNEIIEARREITKKLTNLIENKDGLSKEEFNDRLMEIKQESENLSKQFQELQSRFQKEVKPVLEKPIEPPPNPRPMQGQIQEEIDAAKKRLAELESEKPKPTAERLGIRSMVSDSELAYQVEQAFKQEINNIYAKRGMFGIRKIEGINTPEWGIIKRLPANKVIEYATGDSAKSGLANNAVEEIANSSKHQNFLRQMVGLMEKTDGAVKPFENESVEGFFKRLGGYVLRTHLRKAA